MRGRWLLILFAAPLFAVCLPAYAAGSCPDCTAHGVPWSVTGTASSVPMTAAGETILAQNIFDEPETSSEPESSKPAKASVSESDDEEKPAVKPRRKKKARKKKKSAPAEQSSSGSDYSAAEIARASYSWAPETAPLELASTAPGIRTPVAEKPKQAAETAKPEAIESRPAPQGFKLPQIPVTQVLIVAAFVILFLIYRFRVGRQMKRKKY